MKSQLASVSQRILRFAERLGRNEFRALLLLLTVSMAVWGFAELADEVLDGESDAFDEQILLAMRTPGNPADPWGPRWLEETGRDITGLGGAAVLSSITLATGAYLFLRGKIRVMWFVFMAVGSGILLSLLMKHWFDRPRPDLVPHGSQIYTTSFPSGHSMMSAVTYLTLAALLAKVEQRRAIRAYFLCVAVALTLLIGISRVYLGVHWPTDVLAGWSAGTAWALLCWTIASYLQRRGDIEQETTATKPPASAG